jgi:hypothetical protein
MRKIFSHFFLSGRWFVKKRNDNDPLFSNKALKIRLASDKNLNNKSLLESTALLAWLQAIEAEQTRKTGSQFLQKRPRSSTKLKQ